MSKIDKKEYRVMVMGLAHTQMQLEIMDELKNTPLYKQAAKQRLNALEKDLTKILSAEFEETYMRDEQSFNALTAHIEMIAKWMAHAEFEDILDLGNALNTGQLKFVKDTENGL